MIRFYQRNNWSKTQNLIGIISLTFIWFLIATPLHELSHMIGTKLSGASILDYQLLPRYWIGDFHNAYIKPDFNTEYQEFTIRIAPYLRDVIIVLIGYILLKRQRINDPFIVGFLFLFFLLNSVYDIVINFLGYAIDKDGDLNGLSKLIGHLWTYIISFCIIAITTILTYRIFKLYRDFPRIETNA